MNELFNKYSGQIRCTDSEVTKEFLKIYENDKHIGGWLNKLTTNLDLKNDDEANQLRCQGNQLYTNKRFNESFKIYTKALCTATTDGKEIGLIAANRSALLFMIDYFEDCLKDIEFSLECGCPDDVKLKLYIRRTKCYAKMNVKLKLEKSQQEALDFLKNSCLPNKESKKTEILSVRHIKASQGKQAIEEKTPLLLDGRNPNFLYASSAVRLSYNKLQGRHVVANKDIEANDVLFVETPFIFAPVFVNEDMGTSATKCYNCLKTIYSSIPCDQCTKAIYCNKACREECWNEFHRWECFGMRCNLWYHIGIGFPALRAVIKGVPTRLLSLESGYEEDTQFYGQITDNYPYFDKLLSNISKMENILPLIISAGAIVLYLENYTEFFGWLCEQPGFDQCNRTELVGLIGARITKHIAQLQCNSSVINHIVDQELLDDDDSVACAIYLSISMMNHSCWPNVKISYIREVAVVRAAENIGAGEEIFNCYGIDCRYTDRRTRQKQCKQYYYFKCNCRVCKSPDLE